MEKTEFQLDLILFTDDMAHTFVLSLGLALQALAVDQQLLAFQLLSARLGISFAWIQTPVISIAMLLFEMKPVFFCLFVFTEGIF